MSEEKSKMEINLGPISMEDLAALNAHYKNILHEADKLTSGERRQAYGHPLDDYSCTADLFTALLHRAGKLKEHEKIEPALAALLMIAVKMSRLSGQPDHRDSIIDIAGYARCIELIHEEYNRRYGAALSGT